VNQDNFFILKATNLTELEADLLASEAFEHGALGTEEELKFEQKGREYEPVTLKSERSNIKIYFEKAPPAPWIESARLKYHDSTLQLESEQNRDWLKEWKKHFKPFELASGVWIVPTWCEIPVEAKQIIRMDPGMAFGTGTHETTRLASGFISRYSSQMLSQGIRSVLDVGTGTGVLAFLAECRGFSSIVANDIDADARRVARENAALNGFKTTKIVDAELHQIPEVFGFVIANIIDGVLVRLQSELQKRVMAGGYLLLTGILDEREALFLSEFSFSGFTVVERASLGEWIGFLLRKNGG
jgi:ribosomal protein L11 methyltransferase